MTGWRISAAAALLVLVAGCATYKVVGRFDDQAEVFIGNVAHNAILGTAELDAVAKVSGTRCTGSSVVDHLHALVQPGCEGQRGTARLQCTDGRIVQAKWRALSCTTGYGLGVDDRGSTFRFVFGLDEVEAEVALRRIAQEAAVLPPPPKPGATGAMARPIRGMGTGFAVSAQGHVLTNEHVIRDGRSVFVRFEGDPTEYEATVVARSRERDLALLSVGAATRPLAFASSAGLKRGEDVFTLGYPSPTLQGQAQKATFGRINALSGLRDDPAELQTDVPVQPGNSGGPLLNRRGAVVGVVASSLARTAGAAAPQNVNYAIKSDIVLDFLRPHLAPATGEGAPRPFERLVSDAERSVAHIVVR